MNVSRSGYYSWRNRGQPAKDQEREQLIPKVQAIHKKSRLPTAKEVLPGNYSQKVFNMENTKQAL